MEETSRTTPRAARVPVLIGLSLLSLYFLACFQVAIDEDAGRWTTMGNWQMFTSGSRSHGAAEAEAEIGGRWEPVDLDALYPTRWDSGPRYARSAVRRNATRMKILAASVCERHPGKPARVRLYDVGWKVTIGQIEQKRTGETRKLMADWRCGDPSPMPKGYLL